MIGIAVQLLISWALLYFIEHKNIDALGLYPTKQRLKDVLLGLLTSTIYLSLLLYIIAFCVNNPYRINPNYNFTEFFTATAYVFRAVIYEELIFRGALLYVLIRCVGFTKATLISATVFGIYHWFSWGILGQPVPMLIAFINTGLLGYLWALLFVKRKSMYLPIALHMGYNFASMVLFSKDKSIGMQLLIKTHIKDPIAPSPLISIPLIVLYYIGFHLLCYLIWQHSKQVEPKMETKASN